MVKRKAGGPEPRKFLILVAGIPSVVLKADSAEAAQEEFLFAQGYLNKDLAGEPRKRAIELARKHKPYLFDRMTAREATTDEVEQYARGVDLVGAAKRSSKQMPSGPKQATRLGVA